MHGTFLSVFMVSIMSIFGWLFGDPSADKEEIEIAPSKWLEVKRGWGGDDFTSLSFQWAEKEVAWEGHGIVTTLREWEGSLYMLCLDRNDPDKCRYNCYRLNKSGDGFDAISPKDFPRAVATKNVGYYWAKPVTSIPGYDCFYVSELELERSLDVHSPVFRCTTTAKIWGFLENGIFGAGSNTFLVDYANKYHPVPLPTIFKETDEGIDIKVGDEYQPVETWLVRHDILTEYVLRPPQVDPKAFERFRIFDSHILYTEMEFEVREGKIVKISLFEDYKDRLYHYKPQDTNVRFRGTVDKLRIYSSLSQVYRRYNHPEMRGNMKNIVREILKRKAQNNASGKASTAPDVNGVQMKDAKAKLPTD